MAGVAHIQPTFHPVNEKILPAEPIFTVRSRIPGSAISDWCRAPSNTTCSHTSSQIAIASWLVQKSAISASSSVPIIVPVGLSGELRMTSRVRALATAASAWAVTRHSGGSSRTSRATPPARCTSGR